MSPNPTVDYFDDLDYFKDIEYEFPAIVYNDGLTSKSDLGIKPLINSECIDELNLINETSLSEYDEEIVSRFNNLFNDIYPDNLKLEKDDDDNDISIIQSSKDNEITHGENGFSETNMAPLPAADQRHPWLRYQIEEYTEEIRRDEAGSGSDVEDGIFWRRTASICESCLEAVWICQILQEISQKRTRERMSDQEAKEIKSRSQRDHASSLLQSTAAKPTKLDTIFGIGWLLWYQEGVLELLVSIGLD
ncbi:hypothetical protein Tco_0530177 [Tanacetum coccineum]